MKMQYNKPLMQQINHFAAPKLEGTCGSAKAGGKTGNLNAISGTAVIAYSCHSGWGLG